MPARWICLEVPCELHARSQRHCRPATRKGKAAREKGARPHAEKSRRFCVHAPIFLGKRPTAARCNGVRALRLEITAGWTRPCGRAASPRADRAQRRGQAAVCTGGAMNVRVLQRGARSAETPPVFCRWLPVLRCPAHSVPTAHFATGRDSHQGAVPHSAGASDGAGLARAGNQSHGQAARVAITTTGTGRATRILARTAQAWEVAK